MKQLSKPTLTPKIAHQNPKKSKMALKLSQNQMSELKETKMKVVQLHKQTPKQLSNPTPTPKIAHQDTKKSEMTLNLSKNQYPNGRKHTKLKLNNYMSRPKNSFRTLTQPPKKPIRAQKGKNDPNIKSKSNARIERTMKNKSCLAT